MKPGSGMRWRRAALRGAIVVTAAYVALVALLFFNQRALLYMPGPISGPPSAIVPSFQLVRIDTADGERLVGWWLAPRPDRPTILFFTGNAGNLDRGEGRWRRIAQEGVGVLAVAYRGFDGSTGRPTEAGLHEDAKAGYRWLTGRIPPRDIVIHGQSLGTGVAARLAAEHPARALVLESPYTATVDVAARRYPFAPVRLLMRDQFRTREIIDKVRMPILIVHGDADSVIPFAQGRRLFDLAPAPKTFVRMIGSEHNTLTRDGLYDHIWRFLDLPLTATTAHQGRAARFEVSEVR